MSSAVLRNDDRTPSSHASAGTASIASAMAVGSGVVCINPAAMRICSFNSAVIALVALGAASPRASRSRRGTDRKVTAMSVGDELLIRTSWHLTSLVSTHTRPRAFPG
jgi:hypothetical protein